MRTAEQEEIAREDGASVLKEENGGLVLLSSIRVRCPPMGVSDTPSRASGLLPPHVGRWCPGIDRSGDARLGFGTAEMMRTTGAAPGMGVYVHDPESR